MKDTTLVTTLGRDPEAHQGIVNPPTYRASTVLSATLETYEGRRPGAGSYGRYGTPTTFALQDAVAGLEGGDGAIAVGSGKTAITAALLALLAPGDHMLVTDAAYGPTRRFADGMLRRFGVETTYMDPRIGGEIRELLRPTTKIVFLESPGSLTFEVQDVPAIAEAAHATGALVVIDNTWASPLYFKPFEHGVDISIQAATKYIGGHSDLMMGIVTARSPLIEELRPGVFETATAAGPDECTLALRGLRTLATRLPRHWESGLEVAAWLARREEVATVMHPALPGSPDHAIWKRDFLGASGLFGFILKPCTRRALAAMLDHLELFGMGASWGGFESLLIPTAPKAYRTAVPWTAEGQPMRMHVGLEDPQDLIKDLEAGLRRLRDAS
jgi:cysteine-S-conjugate beta-lyase